MLRLMLMCGVGLMLGSAVAQEISPESVRADLKRSMAEGERYSYSRSGQFAAHGAGRTGWLPQLSGTTNLVRLERSLLTISCERIKVALLGELGMRDQWRGRIYLEMYPAVSLDDRIVVTSTVTEKEWSYRMDLPDALARDRLVSAVVEVLLKEMANRHSEGQSAEIPRWLAEGLARRMMLSSPAGLVLDPPTRMEAKVGVSYGPLVKPKERLNPMARAQERLRTRPPLGIEELSWPKEEQFAGEAGEAFRDSAQLFVDGLLRLKDGRMCMRKFIEGLAGHLNWQVTFLEAFHAHFETPLDLEKWWSLQMAGFTGMDFSEAWSRHDSAAKLDEIVRTAVQIRTATNELPMRMEVALQMIIRDWDQGKQDKVLPEKVQQLQALRGRLTQEFGELVERYHEMMGSQEAAPAPGEPQNPLVTRMRAAQELGGLVEQYRQTLAGYLEERERTSVTPLLRGQARPSRGRLVQETVKDLDALDARRGQLRRQLEAVNVNETALTPAP